MLSSKHHYGCKGHERSCPHISCLRQDATIRRGSVHLRHDNIHELPPRITKCLLQHYGRILDLIVLKVRVEIHGAIAVLGPQPGIWEPAHPRGDGFVRACGRVEWSWQLSPDGHCVLLPTWVAEPLTSGFDSISAMIWSCQCFVHLLLLKEIEISLNGIFLYPHSARDKSEIPRMF